MSEKNDASRPPEASAPTEEALKTAMEALEMLRGAFVMGAFVTTSSAGDPDPGKRTGEVRFAFRGEGAAERADKVHDAIRALLALPASTQKGEDPHQDPKYAFRDGRVWNRADGQPIPDDEPVFVFRARDRHAAAALSMYASYCHDDRHRDAVTKRVRDFDGFAQEHPDRMKEPDTAAPPAPIQGKD